MQQLALPGASSPLLPSQGLPLPVLYAGKNATKIFLEFFAAHLRNPRTRAAYSAAAWRFLHWCDLQELELAQIQPLHVASYIEKLCRSRTPATVKQHLAALRSLFDWLVLGQVIAQNPATSVRGPKLVVDLGKTPVLFEDDARALLASIDTSHVVGLRDRAALSIMTYSFARVGALVRMRVEDYELQGRRAWFVLHEKGGKFHRVPAHHKAADAVEAYLEAAGLDVHPKASLLQSTRGRSRRLTGRPMSVRAVQLMVRRRALAADLSLKISPHSFRATGITAYLKGGGTLELAAQIAAHRSTRTTQLYNRTQEELRLEEIERIRI